MSILMGSHAEISHDLLLARSLKKFPTLTDDILHAAVGISGEAGELLDAVKKHWAYGKPLDMVNVIEELGDLEYYMRAMYKVLNLNRDDVLMANIEKLNKRYPSGYTNEAALARADKVPDMSNEAHELRVLNDQQDKQENGGNI